MSDTNTKLTGGPGLATLLTVLFVALKLTGVITWSWVWVLSPLWISFCIGLVCIIIALLIAVVATGGVALALKSWTSRR